MKNTFALGGILALALLFGCGAAKWVEPDSWTFKADGHIRASQRQEDFATFTAWKSAYLDKEQKNYGVLITPAGADSIAMELARRDAEITQLKNTISNGCR